MNIHLKFDKKKYKMKTKCECGGYLFYEQPKDIREAMKKPIEGTCTRCKKLQSLLERK